MIQKTHKGILYRSLKTCCVGHNGRSKHCTMILYSPACNRQLWLWKKNMEALHGPGAKDITRGKTEVVYILLTTEGIIIRLERNRNASKGIWSKGTPQFSKHCTLLLRTRIKMLQNQNNVLITPVLLYGTTWPKMHRLLMVNPLDVLLFSNCKLFLLWLFSVFFSK